MVISDKPIPVLTGPDAREFERKMQEEKVVPAAVYARMVKNFNSITIVDADRQDLKPTPISTLSSLSTRGSAVASYCRCPMPGTLAIRP
ncbi:MAG: hypothetical protein WBJ41_14510 [Chromatiaceae bacterium]